MTANPEGFTQCLSEFVSSIKTLEHNRKEKRKRLYEAQDEIDSRRDELIGQIEIQLGQQKSVTPLFTFR
jgi:adenine-specific DNA-methyltransferase